MAYTTAERSARHKAKDPEAYRAKKRAYIKTPVEREKRRIAQQKWRDANREHYNSWARANSYKARQRPEVRERLHGYHLKRTFGITLKEYEAMLAAQGGGCAICGANPPNGRRLHVDHCHVTSRVRGLLCAGCNTKVGAAESSLHVKVLDYLAAHVPVVQ